MGRSHLLMLIIQRTDLVSRGKGSLYNLVKIDLLLRSLYQPIFVFKIPKIFGIVRQLGKLKFYALGITFHPKAVHSLEVAEDLMLSVLFFVVDDFHGSSLPVIYRGRRKNGVMEECPKCEFPLAAMGLATCPKCDYSGGGVTRSARNGVLEVDIAHSGETWEVAKAKLDRAIDDALYYNHSGLKIVHGWGAQSGGQSVIAPRAKAYLRHVAEEMGGRYAVDRNTEGASILWFNR